MIATKKQVTIECFKYDQMTVVDSNSEFYKLPWAVEAFQSGVIFFKDGEMYIKTLEGVHHASLGDYIIRDVNGELYPCKPDIFEKTYDFADKNIESFTEDEKKAMLNLLKHSEDIKPFMSSKESSKTKSLDGLMYLTYPPSETPGIKPAEKTQNFSWALQWLKDGYKVARLGWNGKNQFITMQNGSTVLGSQMRNENAKNFYGDREVKIRPHLDIKTADDSYVCGWVPSTGDLFAEDWVIVEDSLSDIVTQVAKEFTASKSAV